MSFPGFDFKLVDRQSLPRAPTSSRISTAPRIISASDWCWSSARLLRTGAAFAPVHSSEVTSSPNLEHALECERTVNAQHQGPEPEDASPARLFRQISGDEHDATALLHHCARIEVRAGETIVAPAIPLIPCISFWKGASHHDSRGDDRITGAQARATPLSARWRLSRTRRAAPPSRPRWQAFCYGLTPNNSTRSDRLSRAQPDLLTYYRYRDAERLSFANRTIAVLRR